MITVDISGYSHDTKGTVDSKKLEYEGVLSRGLGVDRRQLLADIQMRPYMGDSKKLGCGHTGFPSCLGFVVGDSHIPTFWLLL